MTPPSPGASTSPTREQATTHSFQSRSATANSAWIRSASSRSSSTRRRAACSRCSSSPTTDGIPDLHRSDDTTDHHCHRTADSMPDQRKRSPQARKDNNISGIDMIRRTRPRHGEGVSGAVVAGGGDQAAREGAWSRSAAGLREGARSRDVAGCPVRLPTPGLEWGHRAQMPHAKARSGGCHRMRRDITSCSLPTKRPPAPQRHSYTRRHQAADQDTRRTFAGVTAP
ncbi:hypothetical protein SBRY_100240 [Actinacidiphila bryophytorum]|uniref:Uncharacterized protein n=1 Tax=Actinacidiphila bryophytorum TaxID=1436133 RepID=A0A9W4E3K3_9ACTN|nr:hypothetical protein SBRY_100240 [Actinacidiphila bryophytorum]